MTATINESGFSTPYINFKYKDYHVATQIYSNNTYPYIIFKETPNGLECKTFIFDLNDSSTWWVNGIILGSDYNVYVFDEKTFDSRNKTYYYYNLGSIEEIYNETNTITGPFCITGSFCDTAIQTLCTEYLHYNILNNIIYDSSNISSIIKFILKNDYCIIQPIFCEANPNISTYMNFQCYCNEDASIIYTGRYQNKIGLLIADK